MDYKEETQKVYDKFPEHFDLKFGEYSNIIKEELEETIKLFPPNSKILDLGSGSGNHALFFKNKGFDVLCLDISDGMLSKCREKGLKTIKMDFEELEFPEKSFDVVWAYTSLLHISKEKTFKVVDKISFILKDNGFLMISFKEGIGEGAVDFRLGGKRWFSLYTDEEIRQLLEKDFIILKNWKNPVPNKSDKVFLDYFCRKR